MAYLTSSSSAVAPIGPVGLGQYESDDTGLEQTLRDNVDAAKAYLRDRWADFLNLSPRIIDLQHRAAEAAYRAGQAGEPDRKAALQDIIRALGELNVAHGKAVDMFHLEAIGDKLGLSGYEPRPAGLGALPIAGLVGLSAFSTLALIVLWAFRSYEIQERKLDMLESGYSVEAIAAVGDPGPSPIGFFGALGDIGKLVLWGGLAWLALQAFQTWRANPPLEVWHANPPETFGRRVYDITYRHDDDGLDYIHEFGPSVALEALDDGSVRLYHVDGRPLWADFEVE